MVNRPGHRQKMSFTALAIISIAATALLVVGSLWLASRLSHHSPVAGSPAPGNLRRALRIAQSYERRHGNFGGLAKSGALASGLPGLFVVPISTSPSQISTVVTDQGRVLVLTALEHPVHGVPPGDQCVGIAVVSSVLGHPFYGGYPVTQSAGTYYFLARLSGPGRTCDAALVKPPPTGHFLRTRAFPAGPVSSKVPLL
jgi:hypothetical protein